MAKNIKKIANEHINKTYGNLIQYDDPSFSEINKLWNVNLKSLYPKIIIDDNIPPIREMYFVTFSNLGNIKTNIKILLDAKTVFNTLDIFIIRSTSALSNEKS